MYNDPNTNPTLDPAMENPLMNERFLEGTPVFDLNGEKVGDVSEHLIQQGKLVIHRGLLKKDVYLPLNTITRNSQSGVYLNIGKDEVKRLEDVGPMADSQRQDNMAPQDANQGRGMGRDMNTAAPTQQPLPPNQAVDMPMGTAGTTPVRDGDMAIPVHEEQMRVEHVPDTQSGGNVRVHRDVIEQQQSISMPVTHEELRVEHNPIQGDMPAGDEAFSAKDVEIPLRGEQLKVTKEPRVVDEVHLHKQPVTEEQQAAGTVRKENVRVEGQNQPGQDMNRRDASARNASKRDIPNRPDEDINPRNVPNQPNQP